MIAIRQMKFATSVRLGPDEYTHIQSGNGVEINWDESNLKYVLSDSRDKAKHLPIVWVHPTNVQYAVPMEMQRPDAQEGKKKSAGK